MAIKAMPNGSRQVYVYDPRVHKKVYVKPGDFGKKTPQNDRQARDLEREAILHYKRLANGQGTPDRALSVREYSEEWLEVHHGEGTRRPSPNTLKQNQWAMRGFLEKFGDRAIDGGIKRKEALRWSRDNRLRAEVAAAMFNDAFDDEETTSNPFANRRQKQGKGREEIAPLTEQEVERMADLAIKVHGEYGLMCRGWILFLAWVGTRPGETFGLEWPALDFDGGLVTVKRCKPPYNTDEIVFAKRAQDAALEIPGAHEGRIFSTTSGLKIQHGSCGYYWNPIRAAFLAHDDLTDERRKELLRVKGALDPYALRHHCASQIVANGGDEYDVAAQLGNTPEVARIYCHDYKERRISTIRQALDGASVRSLDAARKKRGA